MREALPAEGLAIDVEYHGTDPLTAARTTRLDVVVREIIQPEN
jgi:hypothetical protein